MFLVVERSQDEKLSANHELIIVCVYFGAYSTNDFIVSSSQLCQQSRLENSEEIHPKIVTLKLYITNFSDVPSGIGTDWKEALYLTSWGNGKHEIQVKVRELKNVAAHKDGNIIYAMYGRVITVILFTSN